MRAAHISCEICTGLVACGQIHPSAMTRQMLLALTAATLLLGLEARACEKHLNGHQTGSETNLEAARR